MSLRICLVSVLIICHIGRISLVVTHMFSLTTLALSFEWLYAEHDQKIETRSQDLRTRFAEYDQENYGRTLSKT